MRSKTARRSANAAAAAALVAAMLMLPHGEPAWAGYPSWSDVQKARASEAASRELIGQLRSQIAELKDAAVAAQLLAEQRGAEFAAADEAFQEASVVFATLEQERAAAEEKADESRRFVARIIRALSRSGSGDLTATLISGAARADDLLASLSSAARLSETADALTTRALIDANALAALTDQAGVARDKRDELRDEAEAAQEEAQAAAAEADAALAAEAENLAVLEAQLSVLVERRMITERDYAAGEAERARRLGGEPGKVSSSGWANPTKGWISSPFGYRIHPITKVRAFHAGVDIAGGCNMPIYAATGGKVVYSGWYGTYGNFIIVDHGGGVRTAYAHIVNGGRLVGVGDRVSAGQVIARTGTTGASTGCHLHFEVRVNGGVVDPIPFMRNRGVRLG